MSRIKHTLYLILMILALGLMTGVPLGAADPQGEKGKWDNVKKLNPGQEIKVVMNDAKAYRGRLENVSDEGMRVSLATGNATFLRQDILRVSTKAGSHRARNAALGAAIGGGGGAGIGAAAPSDYFGRSGSAAFGAVFGALSGAAVGAVLPSEAWREVYRAR